MQPDYRLSREVPGEPQVPRIGKPSKLLPTRRWAAGGRRPPRLTSRSRKIRFIEFVELSDKLRLTLRSDRGLSWSARRAPNPWHGITRDGLIREVREYFWQLERERPLCSSEVLDQLKSLHGIEATAASVRHAVSRARLIELGGSVEEALLGQSSAGDAYT